MGTKLRVSFDIDLEAGPNPSSTSSVSNADEDLSTPISYIKNGYLFKNKSGNSSVVKRSGSYTVVNTTAEPRGIYYWNSTVWPVVENLIYTGSKSIVTSEYRTRFAETDDPYMLLNTAPWNSTNYCYYMDTGSTLTRLTNGTHGFPTDNLAGGILYFHGYGVVCSKAGRLYNSNVGDITTWTGTDFIDITSTGADVVGIVEHSNHIAVLSTKSIEYFYDAGNPTASPFLNRQELKLFLGAFNSPDTFDSAADLIGLIGTAVDGTIGVYLIDKFQPRKISTSSIDGILQDISNAGGLSCVNGLVPSVNFQSVNGKLFLHVALGLYDYVYDVEFDKWYFWTHFNAAHGFYSSYQEYVQTYSTTVGYYATHSLQSKYSRWLDGTYAYDLEIVTPLITADTMDEKICNSSQLIGDVVGPRHDAAVTAIDNTVYVSYSNDGGDNYSTEREVSLSTFYKLPKEGRFKRRKYKIRFPGEQQAKLYGIELDLYNSRVNRGT